MTLTLISHALCPYVQRAAIALDEKKLPYLRRDIDLSNKPDWFVKISPLGKTPVLVADETPIFESAVILEYLEDTTRPALHPPDPLDRARHRGWIEFASAILNDIAGLYSAREPAAFAEKRHRIEEKFLRLEAAFAGGPFWAGADFSLVDCAFAPVFRYFEVFETLGEKTFFDVTPKLRNWLEVLAKRPSVKNAATPDYDARLIRFLQNRDALIGRRAA